MNLTAVDHTLVAVRLPASSRSITRFFAAWATQAAVGCAVAPRTRIRRLLCSMTARTYKRVPLKVGTSKKSQDDAIFECLEIFHNRQRRHSYPGIRPIEAERFYVAPNGA